MRKRKSARQNAIEINLPELFDQLELALAAEPARNSVCKALSDLNRRLGSSGLKAAARPKARARPQGTQAPRRRVPQAVVESLPLFV
ncbi:uncharacterized protein YdeI (YjbR/CyaY-like superfamily) [Paraburkholderia sp. GAS199]|uniref:hypothetical protein n=1 Tax=Paraburkholderia sp. GAS199 TaxID=3035126 RepID=UPI003D1EA387